MVNPPFGARLGEAAKLVPLYAAMGRVLRERFIGWRVGLVAQEARLAQATGLPFLAPGAPVPHGGLRVTLWRTGLL
jgi:putative N6-adenine-specific DNA methylase